MTLTAGINLRALRMRGMDTVGDGTGTKNIIQDYTGNPTLITYRPAVAEIFLLHTLTVQYTDAGTFQQNVYASLPNPLTVGVGISLYNREDQIIGSFTDGSLVTRNDEWLRLSYRFQFTNWGGTNQNSAVMVLNTEDFGNTPLVVDGTLGHYMGVTVADDFTDLVSQNFIVKGLIK